MIVLARDIAGDEEPILPLLDVTRGAQRVRAPARFVRGRPRRSTSSASTPVHAVFIRAPIIERTGPDVDVLARLDDGRIVAVRERNILATAFHPELAGETRFHRLSRRWPPSTTTRARAPAGGPTRRAGRSPDDRHPRPPRKPGQGPRRPPDRPRRARRAVAAVPVRRCRRRARWACPVSGPPIGVFSLFRLPLGAFRPNDLHVRLRGGRPDRRPRPRRARVDPRRVDDRGARRRRAWPMPATSATGSSSSSCARARKRGAARFHVACADVDGNVELLMQAGFIRYGEEQIMFRPGRVELPAPWTDKAAADARIRPAQADRRARAPPAVRGRDAGPGRPARGASGCPTGSARATTGACRARASPRSCASPTSRRTCRSRRVAARTGPSSTGSSRSASPRRTSRTISRSLARPEADPTALIEFGLGIIAARTTKGGDHRHDHGVISPVRTYEAPLDRRLEDAAFGSIASVTLLMKETLVRVAEPALVPAGVR